MEDVAGIVKKHLNELSIYTVRDAMHKRMQQDPNFKKEGSVYEDYKIEFTFEMTEKVNPYFSVIDVLCYYDEDNTYELGGLPIIQFAPYSSDVPDNHFTLNVEIIDETDGWLKDQHCRIEDYPMNKNIQEVIFRQKHETNNLSGLMHILSEDDAKKFSAMIMEQTGIDLAADNFIADGVW